MLIIAAVAPLACTIGTVPLLYAFGSGAAAPFSFVVSTVVLLLFAVGYAQMSRRVSSGGALYRYVARGLGPSSGLGAAFIAVLAYIVFNIGNLAYTGYYGTVLLHDLFHLDVSWISNVAILGLLIGALGFRQLDVSARVIVVLLIFEFGLLLLFDGAILAHHGLDAFTVRIFDPGLIASGSPSIGLMFAFLCYLGFESAAIYSDEVRSPKRSIPIALYSAVTVLGIFYIATTWLTIGLVGTNQIRSLAAADPPALYLILNTRLVGQLGTKVMELFMVTSVFASTLAIHNAATRYVFNLGRQGCFPALLGRAHQRYGSPHCASIATSLVTVLPCIAFGLAGVAPIVGVGSITTALGTIGILILQAMSAVAIIVYFIRCREVHWWRTLTAPLLAAMALMLIVYAGFQDFGLLSGTSATRVGLLPWSMLVALAVGFCYARWAKKHKPGLHAELARP